MTNFEEQPARQRLTRSRDRVLGGVAGGLARYFNVDPTLVRVLWIAAVVLTQVAAVVAYALLWVLVPQSATHEAPNLQSSTPDAVPDSGDARSRGLLLVGGALVVVGTLLLARELPLFGWLGWGWLGWGGWGLGHLLWPALLVAAGVALLARGREPS